MRSSKRVQLLAILMTMSVPASTARADFITVVTTTDWRAIAPVGNLEGTPINTVGLAWEAANPGWNSSLGFDDSNGAGWHNSVPRGPSFDGIPAIWGNGITFDGDTPTYFRHEFLVGGISTSGLLDLGVDDDAQVYLNGVLVIDKATNHAGAVFDVDVTSFLVWGTNLLAVKAHDSFPGPFFGDPNNYENMGIRVDIQFTPASVPEPSSVILVGLALAASSGMWLRKCRRAEAASVD